ncbi:hypothetical protein [Rhizobium sp. Rhizsp82]|uniref:hypothetical protein n=1 Tax=Rhizobium sp. Rhizsp82 TaxID=3243057 RepID=UPI0039B542A5
MFRSFQTRILGDQPVLERYAAVMSRAERKLFALMQAGRQWKGDLHRTLYPDLGISATHLDMVYRQLLARLRSARDLGRLHVRELEIRLATERLTLDRRRQALRKTVQSLAKLGAEEAALSRKIRGLRQTLGPMKHQALRIRPLKTLLDDWYRKRRLLNRVRSKRRKLLRGLHFGQRKVQRLSHRLDKERAQLEKPSLCFGTRKAFRACFLGPTRPVDGAVRWRYLRERSFTIEGDSSREGGNPFARLKERPDGAFDLELRLPVALRALSETTYTVNRYRLHTVLFRGLRFPHGEAALKGALASHRPITIKFISDAKSWRIIATLRQGMPEVLSLSNAGAIGVDFNSSHVAAVVVDEAGNPGRSLSVPASTRGRSATQSTDLIRKSAARLVSEAKAARLPIVIEYLDFSYRRIVAERWRGPPYMRSLYRLPYAKFREAMLSAAARNGVRLFQVDSHNSSRSGHQRFARRYGLSIHHAAAVVIARRAMIKSELRSLSSGYNPGKASQWHPTATREERKACIGKPGGSVHRIDSGGAAGAQSVGGSSPTRRVHWLDSG